jgi:hypothetical protein
MNYPRRRWRYLDVFSFQDREAAKPRIKRVKKKRKVEVKEFVQDGKYMRTVFRDEWEEYSTDEEEVVPAVLKVKNGGVVKKDVKEEEVKGKGKKRKEVGSSKDIRSFFKK